MGCLDEPTPPRPTRREEGSPLERIPRGGRPQGGHLSDAEPGPALGLGRRRLRSSDVGGPRARPRRVFRLLPGKGLAPYPLLLLPGSEPAPKVSRPPSPTFDVVRRSRAGSVRCRVKGSTNISRR